MAILEKHGIFRFGDRPEAPPNDPAAETPDAVHERVLLRDYRSWIERPAPPKSGNKDGLDAVEELFRERVVEMPETEEQVAFETVARVREQIVIRKEARTRVQHVHATTRRSEVEIETLAQTSALKR
jgi:stress response protein YsnF